METAFYNLAGKKISEHDCKIISLVLKGNLRKNICTALDITDNTLDTEMRILYAKLQIHDKIELFKIAIHNGFSDDGSYTNLPHWQENEQTQSSTADKIKRKKPHTRKPRDKRNELF
jgi:hypothetical protein